MSSIRPYAEGPDMADGEFLQSALTQPLSIWRTLGITAQEGALQTPGLGTALREGYAPPLANEVIGGGRGGARWRTLTQEEVAKRGDKLYSTADEFKASPHYRENIPFEKSMTESRAKALAEMNDSSAVRQFYASKRPVTAFFGNVAGSALDPINYIPIFGEVAYAAATIRVGRIAGRALIGSADAGINAAIFGALTAPQRAKFGDDVSWQAIMMGSAYAAMAGAVIGGGIGTVTRGPKIKAERVTPEAIAPERLTPESAVPSETMSGTATARFEPVRPVSVADVVSRLETAANRIKAAEVMNDAADGLATRGEVALGERAQFNVAEMQAIVARAKAEAEPRFVVRDGRLYATETANDIGAPMHVEWQSDASKERPMTRQEKERFAAQERKANPKSAATVVPVASGPGRVGAEFTGAMDPITARVADEIRGSIIEAQSQASFKVESAAPNSMIDPSWATAPVINFSRAALDAPPATLKSAEAKIAANPKPDASPEQAAIDNAIADAKEEGFDPETGEHDMQPEIDSLRKQELLTADEEKALSAADESYDLATAWEKAMEIARTCYLK